MKCTLAKKGDSSVKGNAGTESDSDDDKSEDGESEAEEGEQDLGNKGHSPGQEDDSKVDELAKAAVLDANDKTNVMDSDVGALQGNQKQQCANAVGDNRSGKLPAVGFEDDAKASLGGDKSSCAKEEFPPDIGDKNPSSVNRPKCLVFAQHR